MRQAVGEADNNRGAFLGEAEHTGLLPAHWRRQRQALQHWQIRIGLAVRGEHLDIDTESRPEVVSQPGRRRRIWYRDHTAKARQVRAAGEFGKLALY